MNHRRSSSPEIEVYKTIFSLGQGDGKIAKLETGKILVMGKTRIKRSRYQLLKIISVTYPGSGQ